MPAELRAGGVHHLAVVVDDLARAESFYGHVLGLPVVRRWADEAGRARAVWLELTLDTFLALERAGAPGPRRGDSAAGWHCIALRITPESRETWRAHLQALGHSVERESDYTLYLRDPEGNLVGLSHYPEKAADPSTAGR